MCWTVPSVNTKKKKKSVPFVEEALCSEGNKKSKSINTHQGCSDYQNTSTSSKYTVTREDAKKCYRNGEEKGRLFSSEFY